MSWFSDFQEKAKKALETTVKQVDRVLDIKEEPNLDLSLSSELQPKKSTEQRLAEHHASIAAQVCALLLLLLLVSFACIFVSIIH